MVMILVVVMMFVAECVLCCALLVMMCGLFYCLLENCGLHSELREKEERVAVLEHDFELAKAAMMKLAARKHEVELKLWALECDHADLVDEQTETRRRKWRKSWHDAQTPMRRSGGSL